MLIDLNNYVLSARPMSLLLRRLGGSRGLLTTLLWALGFELAENTEAMVDLFRRNTGNSDLYRGDSAVNVFGDLLSCAMGYNFASYVASQVKDTATVR